MRWFPLRVRFEIKTSLFFIFVEDNFLPVWHYGSILSYLLRSLSSLIFKELTRNNISLAPLWEGQGPLVSSFMSRSSRRHHYIPCPPLLHFFEYFSLSCPQCSCFISLWITPVFWPPLEQWPVMTSVNNINFPWKLLSLQKYYSVPPPKKFFFLVSLKVIIGDCSILRIHLSLFSVEIYDDVQILTRFFILLFVSIFGKVVLKIISRINGANKLVYLKVTACYEISETICWHATLEEHQNYWSDSNHRA